MANDLQKGSASFDAHQTAFQFHKACVGAHTEADWSLVVANACKITDAFAVRLVCAVIAKLEKDYLLGANTSPEFADGYLELERGFVSEVHKLIIAFGATAGKSVG